MGNKARLDILTLQQAETPAGATQSDLAKINRFSQVALSEADVFVRHMILMTNGPIKKYSVWFNDSALTDVAALTPGKAVLRGHDQSTLPIGRFFDAEVVSVNGVKGVRASFFWAKNTDGANDLAVNIDTGVYKSVSAFVRVDLIDTTCSICGDQSYRCGHVFGEEYDGKICLMQINHVLDMPEGSIVYAGADPHAVLTHCDGCRRDVDAAVNCLFGQVEMIKPEQRKTAAEMLGRLIRFDAEKAKQREEATAKADAEIRKAKRFLTELEIEKQKTRLGVQGAKT